MPFLQKWGNVLVLVILVIFIFSPIIYKMIFEFPGVDYLDHLDWAEHMLHPTDSNNVPLYLWAHAIWHFLVILFSFITNGSFPVAGFLVTLSSIVLMALVQYNLLKPILLANGISLWWGVIIAIGLNLVANIYLYAIWDKKLYFGYLGLITYHNPTIILLRPLAIFVFIWALRCFQAPSPVWRQVAIAAILSILATITKPSFAICFLPALGLMILWYFLRKRPLDWNMIILGFMLPTLLVLAWQYWMTYLSKDASSIEFAPFGVMNMYSAYLGQKFLLSILFPAMVTVFYLKDTIKDNRMLLAWVTLALGSFYTYFLGESGYRFMHGNFLWSGEIALLVIFCISTLFFIEKIKENSLKTVLLVLLWVLHVVCGIGYYLQIMLNGTYY